VKSVIIILSLTTIAAVAVAALAIAAKLPPITVSVSIIARDITVSGDY